jgi:hypothetical protein
MEVRPYIKICNYIFTFIRTKFMEQSTGDSRYTRYRYPCFRKYAVIFQYHEEHQYPVRGHGRCCRAGPLELRAQLH